MNERNTWLFAAIAYGFLAVSSIGLLLSRMAQAKDLDALLVIRVINAVLSPMLFAVALIKLLLLPDGGEDAETAVCPGE